MVQIVFLKPSEPQNLKTSKPQNLKTSKPQNLKYILCIFLRKVTKNVQNSQMFTIFSHFF